MNRNHRSDWLFERALTPCGRTRREFLWEAGGGFVGTALAALLAGDGFLPRSAAGVRRGPATRFAAGAQGTAFSGEGQGVHRAVHVRRRQSGRYVRSQAGAIAGITASRSRLSTAIRFSRAGIPASCWPRLASSPGMAKSGIAVSDLYPALRPVRRRHGGRSAACTPTASRTARACSR